MSLIACSTRGSWWTGADGAEDWLLKIERNGVAAIYERHPDGGYAQSLFRVSIEQRRAILRAVHAANFFGLSGTLAPRRPRAGEDSVSLNYQPGRANTNSSRVRAAVHDWTTGGKVSTGLEYRHGSLSNLSTDLLPLATRLSLRVNVNSRDHSERKDSPNECDPFSVRGSVAA